MSRITQRKGDTATTQAVATFTRKGWDVSLPVTESAAYDLIVDTPQSGLVRVQAKYSSRNQVDVRQIHSNAQGYVVRKTQEDDYDWLYVFWEKADGTAEEHLFQQCFAGRNSITLIPSSLIAVHGGLAESGKALVLKTSEA